MEILSKLYLELANVVPAECRSARELELQKIIDRRGVTLMMIAEGCSDPAGAAQDSLSENDEGLRSRYARHRNKAAG